MSDQIIREIPLIQRYSRHNEGEDWRFRNFLKTQTRLTTEAIDREAHALTEEVWKEIDCLQCANCCKTLQIVVDQKDIVRLAAHLKMNVAQFVRTYVVVAEDGVKLLKSNPCALLGADNKCTVYEVRPQACRDFPFLYDAHFASRSLSMIDNCSTCPIVFNVWRRLKTRLGFRRDEPKKGQAKKKR